MKQLCLAAAIAMTAAFPALAAVSGLGGGHRRGHARRRITGCGGTTSAHDQGEDRHGPESCDDPAVRLDHGVPSDEGPCCEPAMGGMRVART